MNTPERAALLNPVEHRATNISPLSKGLGEMDRALSVTKIAERGWNLLREDLSLPVAVLYESRLAHNLEWMRQFVAAYAAKLAPHGKTTMAPKLFARQLQAGAWGITLATAPQTRAAYEHGVRRVLMANQLVGRQNMATVARLLEDPEFEFYCLVDSAEQVEPLGRFFRGRGQRLNVLLELGVDGGRTGVRDRQQREAVLAVLAETRPHLALCGVEIYEGILNDEAAIRDFLRKAVETLGELAQAKRFDRSPVILSGAGSAWYDVVAEEFAKANIGQPLDIVLRPGCYLTHDVGSYREAQRRIQSSNPVARRMASSLLPALQVWAYVQSVPEKNKAIVGMGKRDAAFDSGFPVPALQYRPSEQSREKPQTAALKDAVRALPDSGGWKILRMMDQHAYLEIPDGADIRVGDIIAFDICHPCTTFDKWRYLPVLDTDYRVIDVVETFF